MNILLSISSCKRHVPAASSCLSFVTCTFFSSGTWLRVCVCVCVLCQPPWRFFFLFYFFSLLQKSVYVTTCMRVRIHIRHECKYAWMPWTCISIVWLVSSSPYYSFALNENNWLAQHCCDGRANNKKSTQVVPRGNNGPEALVPELQFSSSKKHCIQQSCDRMGIALHACPSTRKRCACNTHTHTQRNCPS